ncbi:MAG: phenylalanine--tRNA ligase subunit beta, partial [Clostridiales bacterium]|nr:phenylalanine--tRNA ligase subunit beta [Clostridiales bacterium]
KLLPHPKGTKKIDNQASIGFPEIDVDVFSEVADCGIGYEEPSKFPPIDYDLSLLIPSGILYENLTECWANEGKDILKGTKIVDTYDTSLVHSITVRFEFSSNERTLSLAEVQEIIDRIVANLEATGVKLRNQ